MHFKRPNTQLKLRALRLINHRKICFLVTRAHNQGAVYVCPTYYLIFVDWRACCSATAPRTKRVLHAQNASAIAVTQSTSRWVTSSSASGKLPNDLPSFQSKVGELKHFRQFDPYKPKSRYRNFPNYDVWVRLIDSVTYVCQIRESRYQVATDFKRRTNYWAYKFLVVSALFPQSEIDAIRGAAYRTWTIKFISKLVRIGMTVSFRRLFLMKIDVFRLTNRRSQFSRWLLSVCYPLKIWA